MSGQPVIVGVSDRLALGVLLGGRLSIYRLSNELDGASSAVMEASRAQLGSATSTHWALGGGPWQRWWERRFTWKKRGRGLSERSRPREQWVQWRTRRVAQHYGPSWRAIRESSHGCMPAAGQKGASFTSVGRGEQSLASLPGSHDGDDGVGLAGLLEDGACRSLEMRRQSSTSTQRTVSPGQRQRRSHG